MVNSVTSASIQAELPEGPRTFVLSHMTALALHMDDCKRSRGRFFFLHSAADVVRGPVSSWIVSTGALLGAAGLGVFLVFA